MESGLSYVNQNYCYRAYLSASGNLTTLYADLYNPVQAQCQVLTDQWRKKFRWSQFKYTLILLFIKNITIIYIYLDEIR